MLYRIWATLQTEQGIHVESLLTCVGGLAGYACRAYAHQVHRRFGGDEDSTSSEHTNDNSQSTALRDALLDSPLSIWSLVSRAVLKLGQPLPDIHEILQHASRTSDTNPRQIPQLPNWHRPQQPAIVYLKQLWPQTLPIAQRFCLRPMQMPVLYGIALQRAIEHTKDLLSPTLAASISMECAIAMSRVELAEAAGSLLPASSKAVSVRSGLATPDAAVGAVGAVDAVCTTAAAATPKPPRTLSLPSMRTSPSRKRKAQPPGESSASRGLAMMKRVPPSARTAAIACLAFIATASAVYRADGDQRSLEPTVLALASRSTQPADTSQPGTPSEWQEERNAASQPGERELSSEFSASELSATELSASNASDLSANELSATFPSELIAATPTAQGAYDAPSQPPISAAPEPPINATLQPLSEPDDAPPRPQPINYGSDEGLMRDDTGQPIRMAAEE